MFLPPVPYTRQAGGSSRNKQKRRFPPHKKLALSPLSSCSYWCRIWGRLCRLLKPPVGRRCRSSFLNHLILRSIVSWWNSSPPTSTTERQKKTPQALNVCYLSLEVWLFVCRLMATIAHLDTQQSFAVPTVTVTTAPRSHPPSNLRNLRQLSQVSQGLNLVSIFLQSLEDLHVFLKVGKQICFLTMSPSFLKVVPIFSRSANFGIFSRCDTMRRAIRGYP